MIAISHPPWRNDVSHLSVYFISLILSFTVFLTAIPTVFYIAYS